MLSPTLRGLGYATAVAFALLGAIMFIAPSWAAPNFVWNVSPLVIMTMGGWYLGHAAVAFLGVRRWDWSANMLLLITGWLFAVAELLLIPTHFGAIKFGAPLAAPYLLSLGIGAAYALLGVVELIRARPAVRPLGAPQTSLHRAGAIGFVLIVGGISLPLLTGSARGGTIWPEELTLLSARAFGGFFLALSLGMLPAVFLKGAEPFLNYLRSSLVLIAVILAAAFVFIGAFDFAARPAGLLYIGAHLSVGLAAIGYLLLDRRTRPQAAAAA